MSFTPTTYMPLFIKTIEYFNNHGFAYPAETPQTQIEYPTMQSRRANVKIIEEYREPHITETWNNQTRYQQRIFRFRVSVELSMSLLKYCISLTPVRRHIQFLIPFFNLSVDRVQRTRYQSNEWPYRDKGPLCRSTIERHSWQCSAQRQVKLRLFRPRSVYVQPVFSSYYWNMRNVS